MDKVDPKDMKITLPLSKSDDRSFFLSFGPASEVPQGSAILSGTQSGRQLMDIVEEIIEEEAMSRKLKITENTKGGDTTDTRSPGKSKSKKYLNHRWIKLIQKI